jgi:hypothetical protein
MRPFSVQGSLLDDFATAKNYGLNMGAPTLSIMAFSIMTLNIIALSIMVFSITASA